MSRIIFLLAILQVFVTNVNALLNGITTAPPSQSIETQIIQILNQESLLRLELEKKFHALETKVETLESSALEDKKTIALLTNQTHQESLLNLENERKIHALTSKVESLESSAQDDKAKMQNLTLALANSSRQAEEIGMEHDKEIQRLKTFTENNNQSLLHLNNILSNLTSIVGQRLQHLDQQIPTLARKEPSVAFLVHLSHNIPTHPGPVVFDSAYLNVGNAFNTHNGIFTAPVTGIYSFSLTLSGDNGDVHGYIKQNGHNTGYVFADDIGSDKYQRASPSITLHCNKADRVWFDCIDNGNQKIYGYLNTWFSGHLVHMDQ